jgi:hypothetical protein
MQYEEWTAAQTADTQEMRVAAAASAAHTLTAIIERLIAQHSLATHLSNRLHNRAHNCVVQPNTETGTQQTDSRADDW